MSLFYEKMRQYNLRLLFSKLITDSHLSRLKYLLRYSSLAQLKRVWTTAQQLLHNRIVGNEEWLIIYQPFPTCKRIPIHLQQTTFENNATKEKIAHGEQFFLLPHCFQLNSISILNFVGIFPMYQEDVIKVVYCRFVVCGKKLNRSPSPPFPTPCKLAADEFENFNKISK